jgi:hypothetical protein
VTFAWNHADAAPAARPSLPIGEPRARPAGARWLATLLVGLAFASGCALSAEGELPEVEVTERDIAIPAAPPEADGGEVSLAVPFRQRPARVGLEGASFSRVHILGIQIAASGGVSDLTFLHRLRITATSPMAAAAGRAPIEVVRYQRDPSAEVGATLTLPTQPPADVTELWQDSALLFTLEITGILPTVAWAADVGMSFGATITY